MATYATQLAASMGRLAEMRAGAACPESASVKSLGVSPIGRARGLLNAGATDPVSPETVVYQERFHISGCGPDTRRDNVLAMRKKDGGWLFVPFVPGDTRATPQLFHDVLPQALMFARMDQPQGGACPNGAKAYELADTELVGEPPHGDGSNLQTWRERWVQKACGQDRSVMITFTSLNGQTQFSVKPDWTPSPPKP